MSVKTTDTIGLLEKVIENPFTGRVMMYESAVRFQDACINLIEDYEKRGIENVPVSVLSEFIMQGVAKAFKESIVGRAKELNEFLEKMEKEEVQCK